MSFNLSITDKPTHVVVWTDSSNVSDLVKTLTERVACLEEMVSKIVNKGVLSGIEMRRREDSISVVQDSDSKGLFKELIEKSQVKHVEPTASVAVDAEVTEEAEVVEAEVEAEVVEAEVEAEAEEEEVEVEEEAEVEVEAEEVEEEEVEEEVEEAEEEALELDEFEYKGVTYFKDTENQVYQVGADGDLDDTPIGVWSQEKQKVLKYAKA